MTDAQSIINETNNISPAGSLKGYNLLVALKRNKDAIKAFLAIIGAINLIPPFDWKTFLFSLLGGFVALAVKMAIDFIDFATSDVELKKK